MEHQGVAVGALGVAIAARVPVLLWGAPGTGKTAVIRSLAEAAGLPCETVIASIREPSDFAGLPVVAGVAGGNEGDGVRVEFAPPRWATRLVSAGRGILFFDEVSTAPPAVQAALLRVVLERTVGDLALPDTIAVVAAANPPEQAADGWDLSPPLANRFCHLDWPVDARTMAEGFAGGWPDPHPPSLPAGWERRIPVTRSWVGAFVTVRPPLALAVPDAAAGAGRAWPSPRTWDMAAKLLAAAEACGVGELITSVLVRGCVGPGPGVEFLTWLAEADLPDPEAVLAAPETFELPARGDRAFAALSSVAAAVAANPGDGRLGAGLAGVWEGGRGRAGHCGHSRPGACPVPSTGSPDPTRGHRLHPPPPGRRSVRVTRSGSDRLAAARLWAVKRMPYLASALFACSIRTEAGCGTIAVDRRWQIYADPAVVEGLEVEELGRLLIHLTAHLLRDHADRAEQLGVAADEGRARWNRCADAEINDDLAPDDAVPSVASELPDDLGCSVGGLAEAYYAAAADGRRHWDCGSGADAGPRPWDCKGGIGRQQGEWLRAETGANRAPCRVGGCGGLSDCCRHVSTGAGCSPPKSAARLPPPPARSTTRTAGRPAGPGPLLGSSSPRSTSR
jgi:hypothetical protein